jgi:L-lactate dehydrogenase complex protein LldG
MERMQFLAGVRERLAAATPASNLAHPPPADGGATIPQYRRPLADPAAAFSEEATNLGVQVRRVAAGGLASFLGEVVAAHGVGRAVLSRDPEVAGAAAHLAALGVQVLPWDEIRSAAAADLGITGAASAIAATGSIVVDARRAGGRSVSLLPSVHVALVSETSVLATPGDLFRAMTRAFPAGLPSQVVVISGPSTTGDIELVLVPGVHGPRHLWVGLLEAGQTAS